MSDTVHLVCRIEKHEIRLMTKKKLNYCRLYYTALLNTVCPTYACTSIDGQINVLHKSIWTLT